MINENFLYPFSELDATAKEKAKILVENQPFYLAYLAQKLDHAFIEPFIEASLTPNFDDFFEYSIGVTPEGNVGFNYVHIETKRKEDVNILLEFLIGKDFRRNKHSVSKIVADYECPDEPSISINMGEPFKGKIEVYTREYLEDVIKMWCGGFGFIASKETSNFVQRIKNERNWLTNYIESIELKFTSDGGHIVI